MSSRSQMPRTCRLFLGWLPIALLFVATKTLRANQVTFQVDLSVQRALGNFNPSVGDTVIVSGTFTAVNWTTTNLLRASPSNSNLFTGTFDNAVNLGGTEYHKFIIDPGGNSAAGQLDWETGANRSFAVASANQTLPITYFNNVSSILPPGATNFLAAADFSLLSFFESNGISYKINGQTMDGLAILKTNGINCVRLRVFTSSAAQAQADPYDYINNLAYTVPLAVRVKQAGLKLLIDFHYSDTWADPSHQATPDAWTNLDFTGLVAQMRSYNSNAIATFAAAGAMPDYVQVGNEITGGMLWPLGAVPGSNADVQWSQLAQLLNAGIQGIRDAAGTNMPKVIIHIDRGGDWATTEWFFDNLIQNQQVQFDIIGESYYPFWHGSLGDLANCLTNAALRYGKPIVVAETAFPWTNSVWSTNIYGFPGTTNGQAQYAIALAQVVKNVPNNLGAGIFWWGAEYQHVDGVNEAGFDTTSFFDNNGNVLPVANIVGQMAAPLVLNARLSSSGLMLAWPLSGAGMTLTSTTNLIPSPSWNTVTNPVTNSGPVFYITQPGPSGTSQFYRLQTN